MDGQPGAGRLTIHFDNEFSKRVGVGLNAALTACGKSAAVAVAESWRKSDLSVHQRTSVSQRSYKTSTNTVIGRDIYIYFFNSEWLWLHQVGRQAGLPYKITIFKWGTFH